MKDSGGELLLAANVNVPGTSLGAITDLDGSYRMSLPAGEYELQASYLGYSPQMISVTVVDGQQQVVDFALPPNVVMGQEILVTAQALGQRAAINRQLNADGIVNVVSEEQIQELPDANAAEAIGRLPGVSLKRAGGEAQKVVLRGLNDKFSLITLNGVPVPASDASSRGVDLSMFSQSSLAGIEVTKAVTPDMDADAIAGSVNLITKKATVEPEFRIDVGGGYNKLENSLKQYRVDARYGRRVLDKKIGVQIAVNNERLIRSRESFSQGWSIFPDSNYQISGLSVNYVNEIRTRLGGSLLLDFDTKDGGTIRFNNFFNQTGRDRVSFSRDYPVAGDVSYDIDDEERVLSTINNSVSGENFWGSTEITWGLSHALTKGELPYSYSMDFTEGGAPGTGMEDIPSDLLQGSGEALIPFAYNNFREAYLFQARSDRSENQDRDLIAHLNLKKPFIVNDRITGSVKVGGKVRQKNRKLERGSNWAPYYVSRPKSFVRLDDGSIVPKDLSNTSFNDLSLVGGNNISLINFLGEGESSRDVFDRYRLSPMIDRDRTREWYELTRNGINEQGNLLEYSDDLREATGNYDVDERISSAYVMTTVDFGEKIRVLGGVRFENENNDYRGIYAPELGGFLTFDPAQLSDTASSYSASYILPNLHVRLKPTEWFDLRLAATKTLARPDFSMRLPRLVVDRVARTIDRGNPEVQTTVAWNYDVIASFYRSKYGLFTVGGFYKQLDNVFYTRNNFRILTEESSLAAGLPQGLGSYLGFGLDEPVNTDGTKVYGIEVDLQANMSFLPGLLSNIIFRANYSRIQSQTQFPRVRIEEDDSEFPPKQTVVEFNEEGKLEGQPANFGNVALGYDQGGFSGRLSVFFQDDYLTTITSLGLRDQLQKGYANWDLSLRQDIKKITLLVNVRNLSNFSEGQFYQFRNLDTGSLKYDLQVDFRVRYTL
ncbi:TonB-dependent receptor [Neolewinella maritima]|uniref:TonB-dependent receptor n=1 Tax=Neolewinella maritima TaxID=1383882 RepID=UPI001EE89BE0|nr:TonB-dependent receptor [Neolewinella maritima]